MAQIILDSNNNLIQGDFDNATLNNRTKLQTTTTNATTNVYVAPNGSATSAGVSVANNSSLTNASKIVMATNGTTDTQIISGINGSGTYLPLSFYTNNTLAMQIDTAGNVGIGVASPSYKLDISGDVGRISGSTNGLCGWQTNNNGTGGAAWSVLVANNSNVHSVAAGTFYIRDSSAGATRLYINSQGYLHSPPTYSNTTGAGANLVVEASGQFVRSTSSLKYKRDVQNTTHGLNEVMQLRPVTYKGKSENDGETVFGGLIAEEVHEAGLTEFVQYAEDGTPDALAYGNMVSLLTKAIQEQQTIINELKTRIEALESK
jgi:hypothetical protein